MAGSTGIILAAGAVALADVVTDPKWNPDRAVMVAAGTTVSALIAAALDRAVPGFGTGTAVVLLLASVMKYGPDLSKRLKLGALALET